MAKIAIIILFALFALALGRIHHRRGDHGVGVSHRGRQRIHSSGLKYDRRHPSVDHGRHAQHDLKRVRHRGNSEGHGIDHKKLDVEYGARRGDRQGSLRHRRLGFGDETTFRQHGASQGRKRSGH